MVRKNKTLITNLIPDLPRNLIRYNFQLQFRTSNLLLSDDLCCYFRRATTSMGSHHGNKPYIFICCLPEAEPT